MQRRLAVIRLVIELSPGLNEHLNHVCVPLPGRLVQRGEPTRTRVLDKWKQGKRPLALACGLEKADGEREGALLQSVVQSFQPLQWR